MSYQTSFLFGYKKWRNIVEDSSSSIELSLPKHIYNFKDEQPKGNSYLIFIELIKKNFCVLVVENKNSVHDNSPIPFARNHSPLGKTEICSPYQSHGKSVNYGMHTIIFMKV